jgi:mRNA interferase RelE/StbE
VKTLFEDSFGKDVKLIEESSAKKSLLKIIAEVELASNLSEIAGVKKLKGAKNTYRIRMGDYRIGILLVSDTVIFVRVLRRDKIYRVFP